MYFIQFHALVAPPRQSTPMRLHEWLRAVVLQLAFSAVPGCFELMRFYVAKTYTLIRMSGMYKKNRRVAGHQWCFISQAQKVLRLRQSIVVPLKEGRRRSG